MGEKNASVWVTASSTHRQRSACPAALQEKDRLAKGPSLRRDKPHHSAQASTLSPHKNHSRHVYPKAGSVAWGPAGSGGHAGCTVNGPLRSAAVAATWGRAMQAGMGGRVQAGVHYCQKVRTTDTRQESAGEVPGKHKRKRSPTDSSLQVSLLVLSNGAVRYALKKTEVSSPQLYCSPESQPPQGGGGRCVGKRAGWVGE